MERHIVNPWGWQDRFGFVQANDLAGARRIVLIAGQTSVGPDGAPRHVGDMAGQIGQVFDNLETVLGVAGLGLADVMRLCYYTTDVDALLQNWPRVKARLDARACRPSSTLLGVARLSSPAFLLEIEATAAA